MQTLLITNEVFYDLAIELFIASIKKNEKYEYFEKFW